MEEEGIAYSISYVAADVAIQVLLSKGLGEVKNVSKADDLVDVARTVDTLDDTVKIADELTDAAKVLDQVGDIADAAMAVNVMDEANAVVKAVDEVNDVADAVKTVEKVDDVIESGINSVDDIVKGVENGDILLSNNIQKGNYGEMKMDVYFKSQGYERISLDRVTDLNAPTHQGIDGVYYKSNGHPPYIIGEAKYGSSKLGSTKDGMQMSDTWINGSNRLVNAVGKDVADDILLEGYGRILVNITSDGKVIIKNLD